MELEKRVTKFLADLPQDLFGQIDPPQRLLMGPGPVNAHPACCGR
jgi:hypothetical protein